MKFKKILYICFALIFIVCLSSCNRKDEDVITLDNSEPLALAPDVEWAVITDPYAAYKTELGWTSAVAGHCRKGEILQIKGKSVDKNKENWYYFENGWLPGNCLSVFNNRLKAKAVSEQLLKSN